MIFAIFAIIVNILVQIITKELIMIDNILKDMWGKYLKTVADFRISIINLSDFLEPYLNKYD